MEESQAVNPFREYSAMAITMHEMFMSLIEAGFERNEALQVVIALTISAHSSDQPKQEQ